jgi:hypothetical protein
MLTPSTVGMTGDGEDENYQLFLLFDCFGIHLNPIHAKQKRRKHSHLKRKNKLIMLNGVITHKTNI